MPPPHVVVFVRCNVRNPDPYPDDPNAAIKVGLLQVSERGIGGLGDHYPQLLV
jgi:hypothetical protein